MSRQGNRNKPGSISRSSGKQFANNDFSTNEHQDFSQLQQNVQHQQPNQHQQQQSHSQAQSQSQSQSHSNSRHSSNRKQNNQNNRNTSNQQVNSLDSNAPEFTPYQQQSNNSQHQSPKLSSRFINTNMNTTNTNMNVSDLNWLRPIQLLPRQTPETNDSLLTQFSNYMQSIDSNNEINLPINSRISIIAFVGRSRRHVESIANNFLSKPVFLKSLDENNDGISTLDFYYDHSLGKVILLLVDNRIPQNESRTHFWQNSTQQQNDPASKLTPLQITDLRKQREWQYIRSLSFLFFVAHQIVIVETKLSFDLELLKELRLVWHLKFQNNPNIAKLADETYVPHARSQSRHILTPARFPVSLFFAFVAPISMKTNGKETVIALEREIRLICSKFISNLFPNESGFGLFDLAQSFVCLHFNQLQPKKDHSSLHSMAVFDLVEETIQSRPSFSDLENSTNSSTNNDNNNIIMNDSEELLRSFSNDEEDECCDNRMNGSISNILTSLFHKDLLKSSENLPSLRASIYGISVVEEVILNRSQARKVIAKIKEILDSYDKVERDLMDVRFKMSKTVSLSALDSARSLYFSGLPATYSLALHTQHLNNALEFYDKRAAGPAAEKFRKKLEDDCARAFSERKNPCDTLSLTFRSCLIPHRSNSNQVHSNTHTRPFFCYCGVSKSTLSDPFSFEDLKSQSDKISNECGCFSYEILEIQMKNINNNNSNNNLTSSTNSESMENQVVKPTTSVGKYSGWRIMKIGSSSMYQHSNGLNLSPKSLSPELASKFDDNSIVKMKEGENEFHLNSFIAFRYAVSKKDENNNNNNNTNDIELPSLADSVNEKKRRRRRGGGGGGTGAKKITQPNQEVKIRLGGFVGFEYECEFGHKFFVTSKHNSFIQSYLPSNFANQSADLKDEYLVRDWNVPLRIPCASCFSDPKSTINSIQSTVSSVHDSRLQRIFLVTLENAKFYFEPKVRLNLKDGSFVINQFEFPVTLPNSSLFCIFLPYIYFDQDGKPLDVSDGFLYPSSLSFSLL